VTGDYGETYPWPPTEELEPPPPYGDPAATAARLEAKEQADANAAALRRLRAQEAAKERLRSEAAGQVTIPPLQRLDDFLARPLDPITHRIAGLWPVGGRVLLAAQWKAGKTTLRDNVIRSLADGDKFLGLHEVIVTTGNITVLDFELDHTTMQRWLADQDIQRKNRVHVVPLKGQVSAFNILDTDLRARWAEQLRAANTDTLIVDCLRPILDALALDENRDAGRFLVALDALAQEAGTRELFLVHHMGHGSERSRGDSRLRDWPDAEWRLVRDKEQDDPTLDDPTSPRYFSAYGRDVDHPQSELTFDRDTRHLGIGALAVNRKQAGERRRNDKAREAVLAVVSNQPGINKTKLRRACRDYGVSHNPDVDAATEELRGDELIRVVEVGRTHLHYLPDPTVPTVPNPAPGTVGTRVPRAPIEGTAHEPPTEALPGTDPAGHIDADHCPECSRSHGHRSNCSHGREAS
jgi:hypothetical protein